MKRFVIVCILLFSVLASFVCAHWADEYIEFAEQNNIISERFNPDDLISRKNFTVFVLKALNTPLIEKKCEFVDVDENDEAAKFIQTAKEIGIVSGISDSLFAPDDSLTREQAVTILSRAFGYLSGYSPAIELRDYNDISEYAKKAVSYAYKKHIISGFEDLTFRPKTNISNSQALLIIEKSMQLEKNEPGFYLGYPKISEQSSFGQISIDVCTNVPATVFYRLQDINDYSYPAINDINIKLGNTLTSGKSMIMSLNAPTEKEYNLYIVAKTPDGQYSKIVKLESVYPFPYNIGDGSKQNPYRISNKNQLDSIRYYPKMYYELANDIEYNAEWEPIESFSGNLDGKGYRISGLKISGNRDRVGFFAEISRGRVENLTLSGVSVANNSAGIFAGINNGTIKSCVAIGDVTAKKNCAGGICGENRGSIENCLSCAYTVESSSFSGGIAGKNYSAIKNSISAVSYVSSDMYAGGITGLDMNGSISNSLSACENIYDMMMQKACRIGTMQQNSYYENNYALDSMITNSETQVSDLFGIDGCDILWEEIINNSVLSDKMLWDNGDWVGGGKSSLCLIPHPKGTNEPVLIQGKSRIYPVRISTFAEFLTISNNPDMNYLIVKDLYCDRWQTVSNKTNREAGFSGTIDGNGHKLYGLKIDSDENGHSALFDVNTGIISNIKIIDAEIVGKTANGIIAVENYGTILNCDIGGIAKINNADYISFGGACCYNYATVANTRTDIIVNSMTQNITFGGISAQNEGFIYKANSKVKINTVYNGISESVVGGICGYNNEGYVYNSSADVSITQMASTVYAGGICAILKDGEIYKCESNGDITSTQSGTTSSAYIGGIVGLVSGGLALNTSSDVDLFNNSQKAYMGGTVGFCDYGNIQNSFATGNITDFKNIDENGIKSNVAGICGYNENGTISSCVALNRKIESKGNIAFILCGNTENSYYNYYMKEMKVSGIDVVNESGTEKLRFQMDYSFFTKPLVEGGTLGWSQDEWFHDKRTDLPKLTDID